MRLYNRVRATVSTAPGTASFQLESNVSTWLAFAAQVQDGDEVNYFALQGASWEIGRGTYTAATLTLSRDAVEINSSGTTDKISFGASVTIALTASANALFHDGLTQASTTSGSDMFAVLQSGTLKRMTAAVLVTSALASQSQAETGTNATAVMSPLLTAQAIGEQAIFDLKATAQAATIPVSRQMAQIAGITTVGLGAARYNRVTSEPTHELKFRSTDRYLPNGSTDNTNGGWWEIAEPIVSPQMAGALGDGVDDQTAMERFFGYMGLKGGACFIPVPPTRYQLTAKITVSVTKRFFLYGDNMEGSIFQWASGAASTGLVINMADGIYPCQISDIGLITEKTNEGQALYIDFSSHISGGVIGPSLRNKMFIERVSCAGSVQVTRGWNECIVTNCGRNTYVSECSLIGVRDATTLQPLSYRAVSFIFKNPAVSNAITGITAANLPVVTYTGTDPTNGTFKYIEGVVGMTELNGRHFEVANVNAGANTFELKDVDGRYYTAYSSGGTMYESLQGNAQTISKTKITWFKEGIYDGNSESLDIFEINATGCDYDVRKELQLSFNCTDVYGAQTLYHIYGDRVGRTTATACFSNGRDPTKSLTISDITRDSAGGVVTVTTTHLLHLGMAVNFSSVAGMTQINGLDGVVTAQISATQFRVNIDTSAGAGFSAYTSGGTAAIHHVGFFYKNCNDVYISASNQSRASSTLIGTPVIFDNVNRGSVARFTAEDSVGAPIKLRNGTKNIYFDELSSTFDQDKFIDDDSNLETNRVYGESTHIVEDAATGTYNDYDPAALKTGSDGLTFVFKPTDSMILTGLANRPGRRLVTVLNGRVASAANARLIIIPNNSTLSTSGNRIQFPDRMPRFLMPGDALPLAYDTDSASWRSRDMIKWNSGFRIFSDMFTSSDMPVTTNNDGGGANAGVAASNYLASTAAQSPFGVQGLTTGSGTAGGAAIGLLTDGTDSHIQAGRGAALFVARVALPNASTGAQEYRPKIGFHDQDASATDVTDGVYWSALADGTFWQMCAAGAGARTETTSSVAVSTNYIWLGIFLNGDWTSATFFSSTNAVTWTIAGTVTGANLPTGATELFGAGAAIKKSAGATARLLHVDLMGWRYDQTRGT